MQQASFSATIMAMLESVRAHLAHLSTTTSDRNSSNSNSRKLTNFQQKCDCDRYSTAEHERIEGLCCSSGCANSTSTSTITSSEAVGVDCSCRHPSNGSSNNTSSSFLAKAKRISASYPLLQPRPRCGSVTLESRHDSLFDDPDVKRFCEGDREEEQVTASLSSSSSTSMNNIDILSKHRRHQSSEAPIPCDFLTLGTEVKRPDSAAEEKILFIPTPRGIVPKFSCQAKTTEALSPSSRTSKATDRDRRRQLHSFHRESLETAPPKDRFRDSWPWLSTFSRKRHENRLLKAPNHSEEEGDDLNHKAAITSLTHKLAARERSLRDRDQVIAQLIRETRQLSDQKRLSDNVKAVMWQDVERARKFSCFAAGQEAERP